MKKDKQKIGHDYHDECYVRLKALQLYSLIVLMLELFIALIFLWFLPRELSVGGVLFVSMGGSLLLSVVLPFRWHMQIRRKEEFDFILCKKAYKFYTLVSATLGLVEVCIGISMII